MPHADEHDGRHRRHVIGVVVAASGVAALGVGIGLGLIARSKWNSVGAHCDSNHVCDTEGVSINHDARLYGNIGTVVGGVGIAAAITGAVLYVTAPSVRPVVEHARLGVDPRSGIQLGFAGSF